MPSWVSPWELVLLVLILLLIFGPKRLPEIGRSLGRGMREFKPPTRRQPDTQARAGASPPRGRPDGGASRRSCSRRRCSSAAIRVRSACSS